MKKCPNCGGRMKKKKKLNVGFYVATLFPTGMGVMTEDTIYKCSKCGWTQ